MSVKDSLLIGQLLIEEGIITSEQLEAGLKEQKKTGDFICQALKAPGQEDPLVAGLAQLENMAKEANIRIIDMRPEAQPKAQGAL